MHININYTSYCTNAYIFGATRLFAGSNTVRRSKGTGKKLEFSSQRFDKVGTKWPVFGTWNTRFSSARRGIKMLRYSLLLFIPLLAREREREMSGNTGYWISIPYKTSLLFYDATTRRIVFSFAEISYNFLQRAVT